MAEAAVAEEKKVAFAKKEYDLDTGMISFLFGDGETVEANVDSFPEDIKRTLMFHGVAQKGGDSYAGAKGDFAKAKESLRAVLDQLARGEWRAARGEGEAKPRIGELASAIARIKGISIEDATAAVESADEEKRKTWRAHPKIKAAIAAIRAEKAQAEAEKAESAEVEL